jgi:predicted alpha/beta-hydrolase family hydrolase
VAVLHNDPTAAPAHLFIGGKNVGASAAVHTATARTRVDGLFLLGYPLHKQDDPGSVQADQRLYRVVNPILFLTGTRDRHCDIPTLRKVRLRVGAPTEIHPVAEADHPLRVRKSDRNPEDVQREVLSVLDQWMRKVIGE